MNVPILFAASEFLTDLFLNHFILMATILVVIVVLILAAIFGGKSLVWRGVEDPDFIYRKILSEIALMTRAGKQTEDETEVE
jgi:hypothetical protein